jgi:hypothetical protein
LGLYVRGEARARGTRGKLEYLNESVSGKRGRAAAAQLETMATKMREIDIPYDTAAEVLANTARKIAAIAYGDRRSPPSAA